MWTSSFQEWPSGASAGLLMFTLASVLLRAEPDLAFRAALGGTSQ